MATLVVVRTVKVIKSFFGLKGAVDARDLWEVAWIERSISRPSWAQLDS